MLYCYELDSVPDLEQVHSLIKRAFDNRVAVGVEDRTVYVSSDKPPFLKPTATFQTVPFGNEVGTVELACNVAFDSKPKGYRRKEWQTHEAFAMFTERAGLKSIDSEIYNLGLMETSKFKLRTAFRIYGEFCIVDREKFNDAFLNGVGGRRSYGFGLILIKKLK